MGQWKFNRSIKKSNLSIANSFIDSKQLTNLLHRIANNVISNSIGKKVFDILWNGKNDNVDVIIEQYELKKITNIESIQKIIDEIIEKNYTQVVQYRSGKTKLMTFLLDKS